MKFHFVSNLARGSWGGSEELWSQAAARLAKDGHEVIASTKFWPANLISSRIRELAEVGVHLRSWGQPSSGPQWVLQLGRRAYGRITGRPSLRTEDYGIQKPDLVVFSSCGNEFSSSGIRVCQSRGIPYVLIIQSVSEAFWPSDAEIGGWRAAYERAKAAFFVSHANRESTELQLGFRGKHFFVVSNPYQVRRDMEFRWPMAGELVNVAFVGRLEPEHKGLDLLFRVLAKAHWKDRNLRVNIYGTGRSQDGVRRMARLLGLEELVVFYGQVNDIKAIWEKNQMLILPSRHEGLPLAIIEAMMCGRPCLVTNVSGNPEHVMDGETGFIAAGATASAVERALETAWQARGRWKIMGQRAYDHIRQRIPADPATNFAESLIATATECGRPFQKQTAND